MTTASRWIETLLEAAESLPEGVTLFCAYGPLMPIFAADGRQREEKMIQLRCTVMPAGLLAPMEEGKLSILVRGDESREMLEKLLHDGADRMLNPSPEAVQRIVEQRSGVIVQ